MTECVLTNIEITYDDGSLDKLDFNISDNIYLAYCIDGKREKLLFEKSDIINSMGNLSASKLRNLHMKFEDEKTRIRSISATCQTTNGEIKLGLDMEGLGYSFYSIGNNGNSMQAGYPCERVTWLKPL